MRRTPRKDTVTLLADALSLSPEEREVFVGAARRLPGAKAAATQGEEIQSATRASATDHLRGVIPAVWPGTRANLPVAVALSLVPITIAGLLLPLVVPDFPWAIGLMSGMIALALLGAVMLARPLRRALVNQWRETHKPFVTVASVALTLVVVLTSLFVTAPAPLVQSQRGGYDFTYSYHRPTHIGGSITVGIPEQLESLAPDWVGTGPWWFNNLILWQTCIVQLPDQTLGLKGWKADQCTAVPTVDNDGESADETTTTFHIDPQAVWSDGVPITAADFLFGQRLAADPNINGSAYFQSMSLTMLDAYTVQIRWNKPNPDYLSYLASLYPAPLHVYGVGSFAGIFNATTDTYNSALAQKLNVAPEFNTTIPVNNGPFTVRDFVPDHQVVLVKNPRFFSNFFHSPALDKITLITVAQDFLPQFAQLNPVPQMESDLINRYRRGMLDLAVPLEPLNLRQLGDIPKSQVQIASASDTVELGFNQRPVAPNAHANGHVSIFTDRRVRQAFVEAFDRCTAVRALLGDVKCGDPNIFTDESDATAAVAAFDPTFHLPAYNPSDARKLLDAAGYRVVDGVRRNKDGVTPLSINLSVSPGASDSKALAQRMQQGFSRNLQIGVVIDDSEIALWKPKSPINTGAFDIFLVSSGNTVNPILRLTRDMYGPFDAVTADSGKGNPFGIIDAQATQRDQLAAQTPSEEQRAVILLNLHRDFSRQYYFEPMYITAIIALKKPTLCNFKLWPDPWGSLWNMADWYIASGSQSCP